MRMNAVTTAQMIGILRAVLEGILTYVIHIFSRKETETDKKVG